MKKSATNFFFILLVALGWVGNTFAQAPEGIIYQAEARDVNGNPIRNQTLDVHIKIIQDDAFGPVVWEGLHTVTTNEFGIFVLVIGQGTNTSGTVFEDIDWGNHAHFLNVQVKKKNTSTWIDMGTQQLLSVPYALHSKTAEIVSGTITENDPAVAANFDFTGAATGDLLQYNGTKWVKVTPDYISDYTVTETDVTAHEAALTVTESQISDLGSYLEIESDPAVSANFDFTDAATGDLLQYNGTKWIKVTPDYISDYTVTESDVTTHQAALTVTESQISDLGSYLETETDPSVPSGTQTGQMQYWNGSAWVTVAAGNEGQVLTFNNGEPVWFTLAGAVTLGPTDAYNPTTGKIWMDRNLGASQVATSSTDAASYGDLYQWGRLTDGHQIRTSGTTTSLSSTDIPGHSYFITTPLGSMPYDWRSPQNENLWQGVSGTNNPCPSGYRLPTEAELDAERLSWSSNNAAGAFASPLKLPVAGFRYASIGSLTMVGSQGYYWSSTVAGIYSRYLTFYINNAYMYDYYARARGYSVRCLKD